MSFAQVQGQEMAVGSLRRALRSGRLHHAYRFEGPAGVGKGMVALALGQALVCERPVEGEGCGQCSSCRRAVTISQEPPYVPLHPDIIVLERGLYSSLGKDLDEKQNLSTEQVRRVLLGRLNFPPHEGRGRLVVIKQAEEMNASAANALLKTLEEPPPRTYFVLITSRGRLLLDTIRSRTLLLRFAPLGEGVMRGILRQHKVAPEALDSVIELAGGSVSAALDFADAEETAARQAFVDSVKAALAAPDAGEAMALAAARDKEKESLRERLVALAVSLAREGREKAMAGESCGAAPEQVSAALQAVRELERNISPALVVETMLLRMRQAMV
ncbi:MAG: DNA polymerase III subunit [Myxococcales bacterium]|nr:MAG: DNA polymerase III subunit [Myxococcales bacterium]